MGAKGISMYGIKLYARASVCIELVLSWLNNERCANMIRFGKTEVNGKIFHKSRACTQCFVVNMEYKVVI